MSQRALKVDAFEIFNKPDLDTIGVYLEDFQAGQGRITITCFGSSWTAYWGAMSVRNIRQFVKSAGTDYLLSKLGYGYHLKQRKTDLKYLEKIIKVVKDEL